MSFSTPPEGVVYTSRDAVPGWGLEAGEMSPEKSKIKDTKAAGAPKTGRNGRGRAARVH